MAVDVWLFCSKGALMTRSSCKFKASSSVELLLRELQPMKWIPYDKQLHIDGYVTVNTYYTPPPWYHNYTALWEVSTTVRELSQWRWYQRDAWIMMTHIQWNLGLWSPHYYGHLVITVIIAQSQIIPHSKNNVCPGVTVCACMRFACVMRSGYLVLANQHTSSEGQGSRDLRQTRVEPYWIEIVGHSSTKHKFSLPLRIFNRL